jgi:pyruvate dehydrogenase E2 component (dihydrolipoamide acetyltransferase)
MAADVGTAKGEVQTAELTRAQQAQARRVAESRATVPDVTVRARVRLGGRDDRLTARLVAAAAAALRAQPHVNGAYRDARLERFSRVNVAVATGGAFPVVHDADALGVDEIEARLEGLRAAAADGSLTAPQSAGATFTVWDLSAHGVLDATPAVAGGQLATLAAGAPQDGVLTLTLAADARGLPLDNAAAFLAEVVAALDR